MTKQWIEKWVRIVGTPSNNNAVHLRDKSVSSKVSCKW